jgi:hypothetical protein
MASRIRPLHRWRNALRDSDLSPTCRHVALTLATRMKIDDCWCWPGLKLIARDTGYSKSTVVEALRVLEERGYLIRLRRQVAGEDGVLHLVTFSGATLPDMGGSPLTGQPPSPVAGQRLSDTRTGGSPLTGHEQGFEVESEQESMTDRYASPCCGAEVTFAGLCTKCGKSVDEEAA